MVTETIETLMTKHINWLQDVLHASPGEEAATISVKKGTAGDFSVLAGHLKLLADIEVWGKTQVLDIDTDEIYFVHEIDGVLHCISEDVQQAMDDLANRAISRARLQK